MPQNVALYYHDSLFHSFTDIIISMFQPRVVFEKSLMFYPFHLVFEIVVSNVSFSDVGNHQNGVLLFISKNNQHQKTEQTWTYDQSVHSYDETIDEMCLNINHDDN